MAIIGEEIEGYVQNQITARQTLHGSGVGHTGTLRTDKQINLLNSLNYNYKYILMPFR